MLLLGPDVGDLSMSMDDTLDELSTDMSHAPNAQEDFDENGMPDAVDPDNDGDGMPNPMDTDTDGTPRRHGHDPWRRSLGRSRRQRR